MKQDENHVFVSCSPRKAIIRALLLGSLLATGVLASSSAVGEAENDQEDGPVANTAKGPVRGFVNNGVYEFLGIPYAAPPVGDLRWRPPVAHEPWRDVLKATAYGPTCAQISELGVYAGPPNSNEDCLYLNVFTPAVGRHESLPVIVYFHGGGEEGESNDFDGSKLASQGDTVVVTLNFRLTLFGVLAHPALDNEDNEDNERHLFANYNILDQQFALHWIHDNIANFGGDPSNVTLSGQSYGAKATTYEILSPLAKGLFQKAILESALVYLGSTPLSLAEQRGVAFAVAAGCGSGTGPDVAACLRALPASKIQALAGNGVAYDDDGDTGRASYVVSGAISDGQILPTDEIHAYETGNFNHVPIITGSTEDEGAFFIAPAEYYESTRTPFTEAQFVAAVTATYSGNSGPGGSPPVYPAGTAERVLAQYPLSNYPSPQLQWVTEATDSFACRQYHIVQLLYRQVPMYVYEFRDRTAPFYFPAMPGFVSGAYHTGDSQYIFPLYHGGPLGSAHPLNADQEELSDQIIATWTNFARTANPNGHGNSPWPRYTGPDGHWFTENIRPVGLSTVTDAQFVDEHKCTFWDTVLIFP
jgi:para-nitrobenzyl esterase